MIVTAKSLAELWHAVKLDKHQSEDKSIIIFAANGDVDSVCAAAQLETILSLSDMTTMTLPVESYQAISEQCKEQELDNAEELRTVFMINCGATEDVRGACSFGENVRVIVIDSHRPIWHGHNRQDDQGVVVVVGEDDPVDVDVIPEYHPSDNSDQDGQGDEEEDEEEEGPAGSEGEPRQGRPGAGQAHEVAGRGRRQARAGYTQHRQRVRRDDLSSDDDEEDEQCGAADGEGSGGPEQQQQQQEGPGEEPEGEGQAGRKRPGGPGSPASRRARKQQRLEERQRRRAEHRKELEDYYLRQAGYGKPSALLLHALAHGQQLDNNFLLWLGILGITDQYMHQRIDPQRYNAWRREMELHVQRLNGAVGLGLGDALANDGMNNNSAAHQLTLRAVEDLRVPLLRHWNIYEALQHTHHVATRMQTWRDVGRKQLEYFLTSLDVAAPYRKVNFASVETGLVEHALNKLERVAASFRLAYDALKYKGFEMQYKNDLRLLATDHVLAITAVLGQPRCATGNLTARDVFREAVECLSPHRTAGWAALHKGLEMAKSLSRAVVHEGGLVIMRGQVQGGKQSGLWICDLSELALQNASILQHPSSLLRLAIFLRDARAQRLNAVKPLVVVGPMCNTTGMCYVVAIRATHQAGVMQNNPFSVPFQEALKELGAGEGASMFTFDNAVFLIKKPAVAGFIEELKAVVQAYRAGADELRPA